MAESNTPPRVFISYSHDSEEHRNNIADLAQTLREQGIDAHIDQFYESPPPLSWPMWMMDQIESADFVLLAFTDTYARRFLGRETPGRGLGVRWEGAIITSELYHAVDDEVKYIPVVVSMVDARLIPPPLSLTTYYEIGAPGNRELTRLLRHLRGEPALVPKPLGAPPTPSALPQAPEVLRPIDDALQRLQSGDRDGARDELRRLASSSTAALAAEAAYRLGQLEQEDDHYAAAIAAYQRALDFGPNTAVAQDAAQNLQVVITAMNSHLGPGGPVVAAQDWLRLVQKGRMKRVWEGLDPNLRLVLAQAWVYANRDHPSLAGLNQDDLAAELARPRPKHRLVREFFASQLAEFQDAYRAYDHETWGAAERPRRFGIDYELVILMETGGDAIEWQPGMSLPAFGILLRRVLGKWRIANFSAEIPIPGWPPTSEPLPLEGVEFRSQDGG
jgi:tetratricopeptide (TPR) repeat protein